MMHALKFKIVLDVFCNFSGFNMFWCEQILFSSMFKIDFPLTSLSWNCLFSTNFIKYKCVEHYFIWWF